MPNYQITEILSDVKGKFACLVSFNGRPAERYEVESLDAAEVDRVLTLANDNVVAREAAPADVVITKDQAGKVVIPVEADSPLNPK